MSYIKSGFLSFILLASTSQVFADDNSYLLNKINLQLKAEQWVTTQTALVHVAVNATVNTQGIEKVQSSVMQHLSSLSQKADWHITSLNRQQEKSGLESVQIYIEARLPQSELNALRDKAKSISHPGETFTIDSIEFTPSDEELKQANINLRNNIYNQAKNEIDSLNKLYPDQKYYLHSIDFMSSPGPMPVAAAYMKADSMNMAPRSAPLSVGNKQELMAIISISSIAEPVRKGLAPNI
jgi:hypothetical protein